MAGVFAKIARAQGVVAEILPGPQRVKFAFDSTFAKIKRSRKFHGLQYITHKCA
jgi:hypothetical protein